MSNAVRNALRAPQSQVPYRSDPNRTGPIAVIGHLHHHRHLGDTCLTRRMMMTESDTK